MGLPRIDFIAPADVLRPFVSTYWHLDAACEPGSDHCYIPGISVAWIFNLDVRAGHVTGLRSEPLPQCFIKGPTTVASHVGPSDHMRNFGIAFRPGAAAAFCRSPVGDLRDEFVDIQALDDREIGRLARDVVSMSFPQAVRRFDAFLFGRLSEAADPHLGMLLFNGMAKNFGEPVARLTKASGYSERQLRRLFHDTLGASPKAVSRICRLRHAIMEMNRGTKNLVQIAAEAGYFDQAHFNRDFRQMIGCHPSAYLAAPPGVASRFNNFEAKPRLG